MSCAGGNIYDGDSEAEVVARCGRPMQIFRADPILITEQIGNQTIQRWQHRKIYVYPGGSSGYLYYLKFENNRLMKIDMGVYGSIPK